MVLRYITFLGNSGRTGGGVGVLINDLTFWRHLG